MRIGLKYVFWACLAAVTLWPLPGFCERYLAVAEAQKLLFPEASRFEAQVIRFTPEQASAIARHSGVKVRNRGNRVWLAWKTNELAGVLFVDHVIGKHEIIDYAVAIEPEGTVRQVEILEYRESHGFEIRSEKWRDQFKGKNSESPIKLNADIYNLSGATLSCRHVTEGIKRVLATFEVVVRPALAAAGGVRSKSKS